MNQIVFDYVCDVCDNGNTQGLNENNAWDAARFVVENFSYQDIYNQIDNLLQDYLAKK